MLSWGLGLFVMLWIQEFSQPRATTASEPKQINTRPCDCDTSKAATASPRYNEKNNANNQDIKKGTPKQKTLNFIVLVINRKMRLKPKKQTIDICEHKNKLHLTQTKHKRKLEMKHRRLAMWDPKWDPIQNIFCGGLQPYENPVCTANRLLNHDTMPLNIFESLLCPV